MTNDRNILKVYFGLAACIPGIYFLVCFSGFIGLCSDAPPLAVSLFVFWGWIGFIVGGLFHFFGFLLFNYYLVRRQRKGIALSPLRTCLPSIFYVSIITILSILLWWCADGLNYGLRYQGLDYVQFYLSLNIIGLGVLATIMIIQTHRALSKKLLVSPHFLMFYNFAIHAFILLFLFPCLGETP